MQQRDQVEDKKPLINGMLDFFFQKSPITHNVQQVASIIEPINNRGPSIEEQQNQIQELQFKYLLLLCIHFSVAFIILVSLTYFNLIEWIQQIPFILWVVLLLLYILSLALTQFSDSSSQKYPKNVFLFGVNTIARQILFAYVFIIYPDFNLGLIIFLILFNLIIMLLCFRFDKLDGIKNCFRVSEQPWRISFLLVFEILMVGLYLDIQDIITILIWIFVLFFLYTYMLLNVQLVEFRKHLERNGNIYFLSQLYFDGDFVFPCNFLEIHLACNYERSILR